MRKAKVLFKDEEAGVLTQFNDGTFSFCYFDIWIADKNKPSISLTLSKNLKEHSSKFLFPFFFNMLPEGSNKRMVCKYNKIDETDYFGLLMTTAKYDSIGAIRVIKIDE